MAIWQTATFNERLDELGMLPVREQGEWSGLELVANLEQIEEPSVRFALEDADRYGADAVFFRQFSEDGDAHHPMPQVYIYDRMQGLNWNPDEFGEIQRRLWNAGIVPLAAVLTASAVRLFSCRKEPKPEADNQFRCQWFEHLEAALAGERLLLKHAVESGTLWEDPKFADAFSFERSAHYKLLEHLRHFKANLLASSELPPKAATRLLVLVILVKYLEDRKDTQGRGVFPPDFAARMTDGRADELAGLFAIRGACIALFDSLSHHFNGGIFTLSETERQHLQTADLSAVVRFMEGTQEPSGQMVFWRLYSFDDLPVELVSNIYEEFLVSEMQGRGGIVYTPPILAELLLSETLPLDPASLNWRILDPACGSGIFLVGAFRRLVHCWRMANGWRRPTHNDLKSILHNSIFGCDLEPEAVLVTAFSLCVALCDELDPKVIWEELRFDDLREKNLRAMDFFEFAKDSEEQRHYDLVIGNPPFLSRLTTPAARRAEEEAKEYRPAIPDNQLALLFLDQAFKVCRDGGKVCLIQPAGPLLYNIKARDFRNWLLDQVDIQYVLDFTPLENILFSANVAAAAVIARKRPPQGDELLHVIFRRTHSTKNRLVLETDYYDFHRLGREFVKRNPYAWKTDLLGGGRLHRLVERFVNAPTFGDFLRKKRQHDGWIAAEGYSVGAARKANSYKEREALIKLSDVEVRHRLGIKARIRRAQHLFQRTLVPALAVTRDGIKKEKCEVLNDIFFERDRAQIKEIFLPPHVLIRETIIDGCIPAAFSDEELVFSKQVFGIHAPKGQENELRELAGRLSQSDLYSALLAATSSQYLVRRATSPITADILALPYPEGTKLALCEWEKEIVSDVVNNMVAFRRQGEKSLAEMPASVNDLAQFGTTYCRELNAVYKEFRPLASFFIGRDKPFVCHAFCYGQKSEIDLPTGEDAESVIVKLCRKQHGPRLFINRIIRLYEQNVILMIKPNQKRFWLRSVAMRDADETVAELIEAGY